jgi:hypothetical protein
MHLPKALKNELAKKNIVPVDAEIYNQLKGKITSAK